MKTSRCPRKRVTVSVSALLALAGTGALADEQSPVSSDGLMTFSNVTVVEAAMPATSETTLGAAGMRAQKDQDTGRLRAPTAVEIQALDALAPSVPEEPVEVSTLADGTTVARLNQSYMIYSVVHKNADGSLSEQCVTGESAADHALHVAPAAREVSHDR